MSTDVFRALSDRVGRLDMAARVSEFGLQLDASAARRHRLGFRDAPLFELRQPYSPDDAWEVRPIAGGRRVARSTASNAVQACTQWSCAVDPARSASLLAALPTGSYFVVRSPLAALPGRQVLLGNEWVPPRADILALRDQPPLFAFVVGAVSPLRPCGPLIGAVILNNDGSRRTHEVLWFAFDDGPSEELLLVLPIDGELLLDNLAGFGHEAHASTQWSERWVEACARWCAGEAPTFPSP